MRLAEIYRDADEKYRCQDVIDKFTAFAKNQGSREQYKASLEILLPSSPIYDYLEGRIAHPSRTYETIAQITEADEKERTNKEIGERRTRLGAKITQVTIEVKREVFKDSPLEELYSKIIDWSNDDELRRKYEEKLLQRCYDAVLVLPNKEDKLAKLEKLAADMVIIKHPYKLAWDIAIEWKDYELLQEWDVGVWREYCSFFPDTGLAKVLAGYLSSEISPFPPTRPSRSENSDNDESDDDGEDGGVPLTGILVTPEDRLIVMTEGMAEAPMSVLAHRVMGEYYASLQEHESVVELMRSGLKLIQEEFSKTGISFRHASRSLTALLGTALVFYQSPRNHPEAKSLFDGILAQNPTSTAALIGIGLIYEEEEDFPSAIDFLDRALLRDPNNLRIKSEAAWVKALNGDYATSKQQLEDCLADMPATDLRARELRAQTQYRIGVCIWNINPSKAGRKDRSGAYTYFLAALKSDLNFAPAYTSLGIFYSDYSKDKKRARKCFQKAFELSPSEVEAAERLARAFAEQGEWDLVEAVAQRVVESGKVKPAPGSKKSGISWPFAALGVAELNKQDYSKSIVSFQSALRISPNDYHSWVGLGESYHNSGRYVAATKAFTHAEKFEQEIEQQKSGDTWFAKYMLANVKRELGQFDESISGYRAVLQLRQNESGVSIALVQTLVDNAWDCVDKGLFGHAAQLATEAINTAKSLVLNGTLAFNLWKAIGDACSVFSWVQSSLGEFPYHDVREIVQESGKEEAFDLFSDVDAVNTDILYSDDAWDGVNLTRCLQAAIIAHKCAIHSAAHDVHAQAVAYYNLGWTEYRAHVCLRPSLKTKSTLYLKTAVRCFKRAIELEAGNAEFWNALGVVTSELAPKVAQHSFVRSLFLNERSAQSWTNLGTLYLLQNDTQLANEAFTRAQSADPEFSHAWLGQGLLALLFGDPKEARLLFTHAIEISESSSLITKRQYALSTFDYLLSAAHAPITNLVHPLFALTQLRSLLPSDLVYQHLTTLFLERIGNVTEAVSVLSTLCAKVEADYEVNESSASLSRFVLAKADLARSQLADGMYEEALENAEISLQLSSEDGGNELAIEYRQRCRLSANLTMGLAHYHKQDTARAVEYIETALTESQDSPDSICLLAQVLWATGDETSRGTARDQLFDCVEKHPGHVQAVLLLGVIALLDEDTDTLEAVMSDLEALRTGQNITDHDQSMVGEILRASAALSGTNSEKAILIEVQSEIFLFPSQPHAWGRLAAINGDEYAADMALKTAVKSAPPKGDLDVLDLSNAFSGTEKAGDAQVAIMFAPWDSKGWNDLGSIISATA